MIDNRGLHPNIISNLKFMFEKKFGYSSTLSDSQISSIYDEHHMTGGSSSEEDTLILVDMKKAQI